MAYDGWQEYNGTEVINVARLASLSRALGIDTVRLSQGRVQWVESQFTGADLGFGEGGFGLGPFGGMPDVHDYADIVTAPWYDPGFPASREFAGIMPLSVQGLDDSSTTSSPSEYIGDGGHSGRSRNATQPVVYNVVLIASTDRGAEYGRRWLDRVLRDSTGQRTCTGADLRYFRYEGLNAEDDYVPVVHRRDVKLTRGTSVTRKRKTRCTAMWWVTFTMTAADPYEYGEAFPLIYDIGGATVEGSPLSSGTLTLTEQSCPAYDYSPIFDPLYPALIPSPTAPDFLPAGWGIEPGMSFQRKWARVKSPEPTSAFTVPLITLTATQDARMVRVSLWSSDSPNEDQCGALFSAVVSYLPAGMSLYIDGEQKAAYVWDGFSPSVRRADSVVYAPDANPVQWTSFNDPDALLVTLDTFAVTGGGYQGGGTVRASVSLVPKSD